MLVQVHSPSCFFQLPEDLNATRNGDWEKPAGLKLSVLKQSKSNGMDLHHCHSLEVPLLHRFSGRWDLWSAACLVGLEVLLAPLLDLTVHQLDHGTPYLTLRQIAWPCLSPWKSWSAFKDLILPWLRTRGDNWLARGLERSQGGFYGCLCSVWKKENGEVWIGSYWDHLCFLQQKRLFEETISERVYPRAALGEISVAGCATCLTWEVTVMPGWKDRWSSRWW